MDAAGILGISVSTLRRLMRTGRIKYFRINHHIRILASEIERFQSDISINEAADILGVHTVTIRRLIESGKLPAHKVGRPYRIAVVDLHKLMVSEIPENKIIPFK